MSKKKPKTSLVNLLRNKKTAIVAALCVVVALGAYVGVHMRSSEAGKATREHLRGTINDIDDLKGSKTGASRSFGTKNNAIGSPTNPFVVLEIVPWQGYAEMSYMVSDCQPANLYKTYTGTSMQGLNAMNMGLAVPYAFPEENYPGKDANGDGVQDAKAKKEFGDVTKPWTLSDKEMTLYGYYEKVSGTDYPNYYTPKFVIGDVVYDEKEDKYIPQFRKAEESDKTPEYFWVTLGNSENSIYKNHKRKENKSYKSDDTADTVDKGMKPGDRFYTSRTEKAYCMGSMPDETCKYYHADDFLRYSVRIRTQYEVDNYNIVVKAIEPWELNENPEWLDYADLMYIHEKNEYGASVQFYSTAKEKDPDGSKELLFIDPKKSRNKNGATFGRHKNGDNGEDYSEKQNDITFEVARKLFMKCNKFEEYNGSTYSTKDPTLKMNYAPIIIGSTLYQSNFMDSCNDSPTRMLNWETMTPAKDSAVEKTAYNNNVYKFCLMDLLMDQTVFYNNFFRTRVTTGKSVIQINDKGEGIAEPHEGKAQLWWNIRTFMPYNDNVGHWRAFKDKYKLKTDKSATTAPYYDGNQGVNNFSYVYNNNGKIYYLAGDDDIQQNESTGQVFDFYDETEGEEHKDTVSTQDIIYYMLHYDKSDTGSNGKDGVIEILDIEPCSDFTKINIDYLLLLFPASDEYMFDEDDFNITHMTTYEFNGSKQDLSKYDMIYFGNSTGKMNATSGKQSVQDMTGSWVSMTYTAPQYNDSDNNDKIFLHVGDEIKGEGAKYRLSGNDVTSLKADALESYVKSGKALVLPDILYMGNTNGNTLFSKSVGSKTNTESFLNNVRKKDNVYALSTLTTSNVINFATGGASVKITGTPPSYNNPTGDTSVKDENGNTSGTTSTDAIKPDKDGKYNLTFTFKIGYTTNEDEKYAVRLLVDKNGDGIISENETGADVLDTWNSTVSAGQTFAPGTLNDEGEEVPAEYTVSYTIPEEQTNGPIAWKFIVYSTLNESVYYEVSGVSLYKGEMGEDGKPVVHEINVLQIVSDGKDKTNANLETKNELFKKYADVNDYKINVKTITLSEYLNRFKEVNSGSHSEDDTSSTLFAQSGKEFYYPTEYMDYSVMLYSCGADLQNASNANGAVSFAAWVSNNDKSVVYTNDSISASGSNTANRDMLKDVAGLSRFSSSDGTTSRYNDKATDASGKAISASGYESLEYTYNKITQGGTSSNKYLVYNNESWQQVNGKAMAYGAGKQVSTKGSQANLGTVCIYPYTIGEDLAMTGALAQDYQLNLEIPGADVWYCMGDYQGRGNAAGKLNTYYAMSPNDPANNYYLYNVDTVFYDAIDLEKTTVAQEMQLFINTLVGAYEFSYGTPYVTVDKVTQIDGTPEELKEDSITTKERKYSFEVTAGEKSVKTTLFKEYLKNEKGKVVHSAKPKTIDSTPTPEPTEAPEPSKEPEPITIWENQFNQNATTFEATRTSGADWMTGLSNNAVIQFTYTSTEEVDPDSALWDVYGGSDAWTKRAIMTACAGTSKNSKDIQVVQMTIGDLKEILGVSDSKDIDYLVIRPANYYCPHARMLSIKLYDDGYGGSFDTGGSSSSGANTEVVKKKDVFTDDDTHIIYFTPHEGNVKGSIIKSFMIQFTGFDSEEDKAISLPVTTIYRSLGDGEYQKITSPEGQPGQFNETLIDGKQYFITYDKENVNSANTKIFNKLEMYIQNDRKEGKTTLTIIPNEEEKPDTEEVYMFNLD
ncbi:MAG: DUF5057 domain-containing protein [Lachnospiraceae bacterium]|nr:DUF5057 domain-containing protein [Lachnospiraceae bacterium]